MAKHQIGTILYGAFSVILILGSILLNWSLLYWIALSIAWIAVVAYGSFTIGANYHLKAINHFKTSQKLVAISFDDGPTPFTLMALDLLKKHNQKASFFCIGSRIEAAPQLFKKVIKNGHAIGNHTYSHSINMGFKNEREMIAEIEQTDRIIYQVSGLKTKFFRPPFGVTNPNIRRAVKKTKHFVIGWNIRSLDTKIESVDLIVSRILKKIQPGSIILLHDTSEKSIAVLERLLIYLQENDYKSITIDELIKLKYEN